MITEIDKIAVTFRNLISIYNETSNFLLDAQTMMEKYRYKCLHGNTLGTSTTKHIDYPAWWFPGYAGRYFSKKGEKGINKAVGILFVNQNDESIIPLILVTTIKISDRSFKRYGYWLQAHIWIECVANHIPKKQFRVFKENKYGIGKAKIMAIPLQDVTSQRDLEKKVVQPLVRMKL